MVKGKGGATTHTHTHTGTHGGSTHTEVICTWSYLAVRTGGPAKQNIILYLVVGGDGEALLEHALGLRVKEVESRAVCLDVRLVHVEATHLVLVLQMTTSEYTCLSVKGESSGRKWGTGRRVIKGERKLGVLSASLSLLPQENP
eukprot:1187255-Prorocentrum_minimum.AAC.2